MFAFEKGGGCKKNINYTKTKYKKSIFVQCSLVHYDNISCLYYMHHHVEVNTRWGGTDRPPGTIKSNAWMAPGHRVVHAVFGGTILFSKDLLITEIRLID